MVVGFMNWPERRCGCQDVDPAFPHSDTLKGTGACSGHPKNEAH